MFYLDGGAYCFWINCVCLPWSCCSTGPEADQEVAPSPWRWQSWQLWLQMSWWRFLVANSQRAAKKAEHPPVPGSTPSAQRQHGEHQGLHTESQTLLTKCDNNKPAHCSQTVAFRLFLFVHSCLDFIFSWGLPLSLLQIKFVYSKFSNYIFMKNTRMLLIIVLFIMKYFIFLISIFYFNEGSF